MQVDYLMSFLSGLVWVLLIVLALIVGSLIVRKTRENASEENGEDLEAKKKETIAIMSNYLDKIKKHHQD